MSDEVRIEVELGDDGALVRIEGELDMEGVGPLDEALDRLRDGPITVDLRGVTFIDSSGLRSLLLAHGRGPVVLREPSEAVRSILKIAGVAEVLAIEPQPG